MAKRGAGVTPITSGCLAGGLFAVFLTVQTGVALAFPFIDPTNQDTVPNGGLPAVAPQGTELPAPDIQGLQNQLRLTNPAPVANPNGWTIIPRLTMQELFTDNVFQATSPRQFDAITSISPGISVDGDTAHVQLHLDYQPDVMLHAIEGPLNALTQQLNMTGLVTIVPDLAYVDVRALSGVQSAYGTLGGGTLGNANIGGGTTTPVYNVGAGTNPRTSVQTTSAGISPYLLSQFKDYGTGKLGVSLDASHYSSITGFAASPFSTGGTNSQSLLATEEIAQFTTGEFLGRLQSAFTADFSQSRTQQNNGAAFPVVNVQGQIVPGQQTTYTSQRALVQNQFTYAVNRTFALLASAGYQKIEYSNTVGPQVNGITWTAGVTVTPNEDSALTLSYGRVNGANSIEAHGHVALGAHTLFSMDYSNTVGTQLESLQNQLNGSAINNNGQVVNATTGGPGFTSANQIGAANGVYRFQTLNASLASNWLRDTVQVLVTWSIQTNLTPNNVQTAEFVDPATGNIFFLNEPVAGTGQQTDLKTAGITWLHELSPDLLLNTGVTYSFTRASGLQGNTGYLSAGASLQYILSPSTTLSAQYSFFDRVSKIPGYTLYQNIVILGFTKLF